MTSFQDGSVPVFQEDVKVWEVTVFRPDQIVAGGFTISRVYFRWLNNGNIPYIEFWISTSTGNFRPWYDLNAEVENGIVIFSLTGDTNAPGFIDVALQPLLDAFVRAPSGYYLKKTGGLLNFSNQTFSMINVDDPTMEINYYDF